MKECADYKNKIIFFDELSRDEQKKIRTHLLECKDCKKEFEIYKNVLGYIKSVNQSDHIERKELERYSVYINSPSETDYDGQRLTKIDIRNIQTHLKKCLLCRDKLSIYQNDIKDLKKYIRKQGLPDINLGFNIKQFSFRYSMLYFFGWFKNYWNSKILPAGPVLKPVLVSALIILIILLFFPFSSDPYNQYLELAKIDKKEFYSITRDASVINIKEALLFIQEGRYGDAISALQYFIETQPEHANLDYAEYLAGLAHLLSAYPNIEQVSDIKRDQELPLVNEAINHFKRSASLATSNRIKEEAYWYLGKAYLMKQDATTAASYFRKVKDMRGKRYHSAREMLKNLRKLLTLPK